MRLDEDDGGSNVLAVIRILSIGASTSMTPLTTVPDMRLVFEVSQPDPYQDAVIKKYRAQASAAIYSYTQIADFGLVFHPFGSPRAYNLPEITSDQIPIIGATLTGTTTSGSPLVTGLPSTVGLFVNQCCASNCPNFPAGQVGGQSTPPPPPSQLYITAIGSNQVTMSQNATVSGSVTMNFGAALWQNWNSYGGTAPGAFQNSTLLQEGCDYFLDWDNGTGGVCSSGIIRRLNSIFYAPQTFDLGYITPFRGASQSSIKLQYYSGGIGPN